MINHNALIPDWTEIILNWKTIVINFELPVALSKQQVDMILKLKMNLRTLWDDYAVELSNNAGKVVVRVKDILLMGEEEGKK